jgi:uncharacterized protein (TIGR02058 family)
MALARCVTEMGMGVDVDGLDYALAATRAVFNAIHHSSLGFARLVGATADEMIVHVTIGVPRPEKVRVDGVAAALPHGRRSVTVTRSRKGRRYATMLGISSTPSNRA